MTKTGTTYERLLAEHLELQNQIAELRDQLAGLRPHATPESVRHWASAVAERLVRLHELLVSHFGEEEASGALEELAMEFPEHSRRLEALGAEHAELLADGRQLVSAFMEMEEVGPASASDLAESGLKLLDRLVHHEQAETELMQRAHSEDLGTP